MKKRLTLSTNEKDTILKDAYEEKPFSESDVIEEIAPLIGDYFECKFVRADDKIIMSFYNGQEFVLTVSET